MIHEWSLLGGLSEGHEQFNRIIHENGVPKPLLLKCRSTAISAERIEMHAMEAEQMRRHLARHLPDFQVAEPHSFVDAIEFHNKLGLAGLFRHRRLPQSAEKCYPCRRYVPFC